jgi:cell division protein FtsB
MFTVNGLLSKPRSKIQVHVSIKISTLLQISSKLFQYTSYSQQLASQIESLTHQLNDRGQEIHHLATREKDLVAHVQQLEGQLQKLIQVGKII